MIRTAQIKFISIVMTILFVVFTVIFGATYHLLKNANDRNIERTLSDTKQSFFMTEGGIIHANGLIAILTRDGSVLESYSDENIFTEEKIVLLSKTAVDRPYNSGKVDNVYYFIEQYQNGLILVASDMTDAILAFKTNTLNAFLILVSIYGFLFFIVWSLSFKVFRPIKNAFFKQKQFISNASHELKTPLTIISANADVLKQSDDNQWVNNIKSQAERMDVLVADMLTLAKFDEDKIRLQKEFFNLSQIVISSSLPFDAVAFEKGKTLSLEVEPNINYNGDLQSVKKIISILLDNAVKHAENGGEIIVKLKKESNKTVLSVFNTGSLIPNEHSNKIFERFYRGDSSRSRDSGGSGLGLSIAKNIADANKWKIFAVSHLNESMKITVIL